MTAKDSMYILGSTTLSSTLLSTTTTVELTELEKLVYTVAPSLATRMERREYPRNPSSSTCPYAHSSLPPFSTEHPATFARFCSPTFTSYSTTTSTIIEYKLAETDIINGTTSAQPQ
jgi:hypothetical protein